jgi:hypothetical protein
MNIRRATKLLIKDIQKLREARRARAIIIEGRLPVDARSRAPRNIVTVRWSIINGVYPKGNAWRVRRGSRS